MSIRRRLDEEKVDEGCLFNHKTQQQQLVSSSNRDTSKDHSGTGPTKTHRQTDGYHLDSEARLEAIAKELDQVRKALRIAAAQVHEQEALDTGETRRLEQIALQESRVRMRHGHAMLAILNDEPDGLRAARAEQQAHLTLLVELLEEQAALQGGGGALAAMALVQFETTAPVPEPGPTPAQVGSQSQQRPIQPHPHQPSKTQPQPHQPREKDEKAVIIQAPPAAAVTKPVQPKPHRPEQNRAQVQPSSKTKTQGSPDRTRTLKPPQLTRKSSFRSGPRGKRRPNVKFSTPPPTQHISQSGKKMGSKTNSFNDKAYHLKAYYQLGPTSAAIVRLLGRRRGISWPAHPQHAQMLRELRRRILFTKTIKVQRSPTRPFSIPMRKQNPKTAVAPQPLDPVTETTPPVPRIQPVVQSSVHATTAIYDLSRPLRQPSASPDIGQDLDDFATITRAEHPRRVRKSWIFRKLIRDPEFAKMPAFKRAFARCLRNTRTRALVRSKGRTKSSRKAVCYFPAYQDTQMYKVQPNPLDTNLMTAETPKPRGISGPIAASVVLPLAGTARSLPPTNEKAHNREKYAARYHKGRPTGLANEAQFSMDVNEGQAQMAQASKLLQENDQWIQNGCAHVHPSHLQGTTTYGTLKGVNGRKLMKNRSKVPITKIFKSQVSPSVIHQRINPMGSAPHVPGTTAPSVMDDEAGFTLLKNGGVPRVRRKKRPNFASQSGRNPTPVWSYSITADGEHFTATPVDSKPLAVIPARQFQSVSDPPVVRPDDEPMLHLLVAGPSTQPRIPSKQDAVPESPPKDRFDFTPDHYGPRNAKGTIFNNPYVHTRYGVRTKTSSQNRSPRLTNQVAHDLTCNPRQAHFVSAPHPATQVDFDLLVAEAKQQQQKHHGQ